MMLVPLPLTTEAVEAPSTFLLAGGSSYALCTRYRVSETELNNHRGLIPIQAWVVRSGRGKRTKHWVPVFSPLSAVAVMFGISADRAARVPDGQWRLLGAPLFDMDGRVFSAAEMAAALPVPASARELATARVDEVKETYGRMLINVAYRLENAALFDGSVPTTQRFDHALVLWAETTPATPDSEVTRRANMVKLTFEAARAHAETIGLRHLPQQAREPGARAAKAARLVQSSTSPHERAAATDQVIRILRSLALPYLPNPGDAARQLRHLEG